MRSPFVLARRLSSFGQVEAVAANRANIVCQDVAIKRLAQPGTQCTAADPSSQATEDRACQRAEGYPNRTSDHANNGTSLPTSKSCADTARGSSESADRCSSFHGMIEAIYFRGVTARALNRHKVKLQVMVSFPLCRAEIFSTEPGKVAHAAFRAISYAV